MATADIDRQVTEHLANLARNGQPPETIAEIATQLTLRTLQARGSIKRLVGYGEVRLAGVSASGAKTWTLTAAPRAEEG